MSVWRKYLYFSHIVKVRRDKSFLFANEIPYLGFIVGKEEIKVSTDNIVQNIKAPLNVTQLKSSLGMTAYYHKHIPRISMKNQSLHALVIKGSKWKWTDRHRREFQDLKVHLQNALILQPFNPEYEIVINTSANMDGVGSSFPIK